MKNCLMVFLAVIATCGLHSMQAAKKAAKSAKQYLHIWDPAVQPFTHYDYDQSNNLLTINLENVHVVCTDLPDRAVQIADQIALMQQQQGKRLHQYDYTPKQRRAVTPPPSGKLIGKYFTGGSTAGQSDLEPTRRQECKVYLKKQV